MSIIEINGKYCKSDFVIKIINIEPYMFIIISLIKLF